MEIQEIIARNIKSIREEKKLTLDAAAALTGVSRSMLAQIEKGEVNPTISVIWKIANGYKVSFTSLMEDHLQAPLVLRAKDAVPLIEKDRKYINYPVFLFSEDKLFETYRIQIEPEGYLEAEPHLVGTEEYITVFSGSTEIGVGEERYYLEEGDSLRFRADVKHTYRNTGDKTVFLSMLIYYNKKQ